MGNKMFYEKEYNLRTCDFDGRDSIKMSACLDFFQEIAGEHANVLECGFDNLIKNNQIWVLVRQRVTILKELYPNSKIKVQTWPKPQNKLYFNRDYRILNEDGEVSVIGSSVWVVCDFKTRRPFRFRGDFYKSDNYFPLNVYDTDIKKLKFDTLEVEEKPFIHKIENSHLDHNGHMNNRIYADIVLNMIDLNDKKHVKDFTIEFIHEGLNHEKIYSYKYTKGAVTYFYGYINSNLSYKVKAEYEGK